MTRIGTKIAAPLAAALAALFLAAGCGGGGAATGAVPDDCKPKVKLPTSQEGKLIVAGPEYPPLFSYQDRKIGGVDGDILLDFAADACLELEVKVLPASGVIESVKTGRADIAAGGWYITPDRAKVVGQSDPVYSDPPVLVSKKPVSKIEDLKGKTIGTTQGYLWVSDLQKYAGDNAKLFESPDAVFADLVNGRIDAGLMAVNEASYRMRKQPDSGLKSEIMEPSPAIDASQRPPVTNFPFKKGNTKLGEALNKQIANLRDSGKLAKILKQHGIDASAANPKSG